MSVQWKRPGAVKRLVIGIRFRLAVTFTLLLATSTWLALRITPRPDDLARAPQPETPIALRYPSATEVLPQRSRPVPSGSLPARPAGSPRSDGRAIHETWREPRQPPAPQYAWQPPAQAPTVGGQSPDSVFVPAVPERMMVRPNPPTSPVQPPPLLAVARPRREAPSPPEPVSLTT